MDLATLFFINVAQTPTTLHTPSESHIPISSPADTVSLIREVISCYVDHLHSLTHSLSMTNSPTYYTYDDCFRDASASALERFVWVFCMFCGDDAYKCPIIQFLHDRILFFITHMYNDDYCVIRPLILC